MVLTEAIEFSRPEQSILIREPASTMLRDEDESLIEPGVEYPVWSPDSAFDAAAALQRALALSDVPSGQPFANRP